MDDSTFTLVTGPDCHLCEHGRDVLDRLDVAYVEVDAGSRQALALAETGVPLAFLPVLVRDGQLLAYGRLSEKRLRRALAA